MPPILIGDRQERRSARRYEVSFRVRWGREEATESQGVVTNLSVGGCFVESDEAVYDGDLVKFRIYVPSHGELTIWVNVVFWVRRTGFGVRFSAFSQGGPREKLAMILGEE